MPLQAEAEASYDSSMERFTFLGARAALGAPGAFGTPLPLRHPVHSRLATGRIQQLMTYGHTAVTGGRELDSKRFCVFGQSSAVSVEDADDSRSGWGIVDLRL